MMSADFEHLLRSKLDPLDFVADAAARTRSDNDLNPGWDNHPDTRPAAVLAPIIKRASGWTMLFTERAKETPAHPGQISFPGGRVQASDADAVDTALRETWEEVGLERRFIEPVGAWDRYDTITGFRVTPIVGLVAPGFELTLDPREVASVFEAPLDFLMNPANHEKREAQFQGRTRYYYVMPWDGHNIWGATAGMVRALWERLYS
ncbi:NUDIX hydrolase [Terricaulis sp.]|uniref:NUDIX hydrolase n=1 Tax=Terricaulis sp. TaxID=2768686 RepID=UPI003784A248